MSLEISKWRTAWPAIPVKEDALLQVAPFPSLSAGDFVRYLEAKGSEPEVCRFVAALAKECNWSYDNWCKVARQNQAALLLKDLIASFGPIHPEYGRFCQMISDFADANNIIDPDAPLTADGGGFAQFLAAEAEKRELEQVA